MVIFTYIVKYVTFFLHEEAKTRSIDGNVTFCMYLDQKWPSGLQIVQTLRHIRVLKISSGSKMLA